MARGSFVKRVCSILALVLLGPGGLNAALADWQQDPPSAAGRENPEAAGDLDPTFGNGGIEITDFFGNFDFANSLALQTDGKIVLGGTTYQGAASSSANFALARYNPDGSLDQAFGSGGKQASDFFGGYDQADGVAIQPDGKIVLAGIAFQSTARNSADFALARYNPDGSLDQGFSSGGKQTTDFFGDFDQANAVAIQSDGKIVLAGYAQHDDDVFTADFALARYNLDGSLDQSFGSGGKVTTAFSGGGVAYGIALQPDGKLVVAGAALNGGTGAYDFAVVRYNPDGTLDNGFGAGGKRTTDFFGGYDYAAAVAIQADGKIVLAGTAAGQGTTFSTFDFALARYNGDGSLDQTFGNGGKLTTDFFGDGDDANGVAIQADGKIVAAGSAAHTSANTHLALARYNPDGTLDQTFGVGGLRTTNLRGDSGDYPDQATSVAIQGDGRIVVAAETQHDTTLSSLDFAVARYSGASLPDFTISFNSSSVTTQAGSKVALTVLINRAGGFSGNVTVTPPAASMGIKPKPPDPVITSSSSAVFKLKVGGGVGPGSYARTFTATDDSGRTRTAAVTIVVQ
jgi:uncharacterized delta-60 repeat protein